MGGSSTTVENGSSQSINQIPQWVQNAGQANYGLAQQIATTPLQQYQGQMVASVTPQQQQAWDLAANSGSVGLDASNAAQAGYLNVLGSPVTPATDVWHQAALASPTTAAQAKTAQAAAAQQAASSKDYNAAQSNLSQLSSTNLSPYMNPYTQSVINTTLPLYQQQLALQQAGNQAQAVGASAFGGSRQGIQQGVTGALGAQQMAQMAAQLNQANFAQAQQAGEYDVSQANNMGQFNANQLNQVGMANQQQRNAVNMYNAGQGNQVNLANAQMANAANQFNAGQQNQVGMYNQGQANQMAQFNAGQGNQMGMFNDAQINAVNQANQNAALSASQGLTNLSNQQMKNNIANYGMLLGAGAQEQQQSQNEINANMAKFNQANTYPQQQLGVLESSLGMTPYNTGTSGSSSSTSTTTQNNPAAIATGAFDMLGSLFMGSDRRLKTDIKKVDTHPSGVGIYSYRYKGDPKTYPKVMGPMAEDVAKIAPHAVRSMGTKGRLSVHMPTLDAFSAGATPPSSPGVATATGMIGGRGTPPGVLSAAATPPTRSLNRRQKGVAGAPIIGALGG